MSDTWLDNYYVNDIYGEDERTEEMDSNKLTKVQLHEQVVAMEQDIEFMRSELEKRDNQIVDLQSQLVALQALNKAMEKELEVMSKHNMVTEWARDKAQQEVKELKDKNKKLRTAITYMLHQLTNKDNPPSIKIAMAIEESIPVYAMLKDG